VRLIRKLKAEQPDNDASVVSAGRKRGRSQKGSQ
jgi:hypothetical protein